MESGVLINDLGTASGRAKAATESVQLPPLSSSSARHIYIANSRLLKDHCLVRALEHERAVDLIERDMGDPEVS